LERIDQLTVLAHFEVQVRSGAVAGRAHEPDLVAALDVVALRYVETRQVAVPRLITRWVADDDQSAVALVVPVGLEYLAFIGGIDWRASGAGDVEARVAARRVGSDLTEVGRDLSDSGPDGVELRYEGSHGRGYGGGVQVTIRALVLADRRGDGDRSFTDDVGRAFGEEGVRVARHGERYEREDATRKGRVESEH